jgi:DNA-binding SARP family transcriptional activator
MKRLGCTNSVWISRAETAELCALALERSIEPEFATAIVTSRRLAPGPRARRLVRWPWSVRVEALGGLALRRDGVEPPRGKAQRKPLELLGLLVAHGERGASLGRLAEALWPDADGDTAHHALETTMYRLRRLLGDPAALVRCGGRTTLDPDRVFVDAWAFADLAGLAETYRARGDAAEALRACAAAIDLYRGDLLPDDDLLGIASSRERLRAELARLTALRRS